MTDMDKINSNRMYLDVHVIQTVPPSNINRDDTGSPKTCTYGGAVRARVSSQSWKRAIRTYFGEEFSEDELSTRTYKIVELVANRIVEYDSTIEFEDAVDMAVKVIKKGEIKLDGKSKKGEPDKIPESKYLFFLSTKQSKNLAKLAIDGEYSENDVKNALKAGCGIDLALFGRMVADDPSLNVDASSQVAHAISTHRVQPEYDFYTAVDEMSPDDNKGAGMMGTIEFDSSTLYRYATVALHELCSQLSDDKDTTSEVAAAFIKSMALSMPTGKQNTFANRTVPDSIFVSLRSDQPINLVGAFESPIQQSSNGYVTSSVERLAEKEEEVCSTFAESPLKTWWIGKKPASKTSMSMGEAMEEIKSFILSEL